MTLPTFNPVALKELRQLTRTHIVSLLLFGFPMLLVLLVGICLSGSGHHATPAELAFGEGRGESPCIAVLVTTGIVTGILLPVIAATKTAIEQAKEGLGLEFTTTLTPRQIINGKLLAPTILSAALISTTMPFLVFCYLMRGVSFSIILFTPPLLFLFSIVGLAIGLVFATNRQMSLAMRILLILGAIGFGFTAMMGIGSATTHLASSPPPFGVILAVGVIALVVIVFSHGQSVLQISPPFVDAERAFRIILISLFILSTVTLFYEVREWSTTWIVIGCFTFFGSCFSARKMPRVVSARAPRSWLARALTYPFVTGPFSGQVFALLMITIAALPLTNSVLKDKALLIFIVALNEFITSTILVSNILRRFHSPRLLHHGATVWIGFLIGLNILTGILVGSLSSGTGDLIALLPCSIAGVSEEPLAHLPLLGILALAAAFTFAFTVAEEFKGYRRHDGR